MHTIQESGTTIDTLTSPSLVSGGFVKPNIDHMRSGVLEENNLPALTTTLGRATSIHPALLRIFELVDFGSVDNQEVLEHQQLDQMELQSLPPETVTTVVNATLLLKAAPRTIGRVYAATLQPIILDPAALKCYLLELAERKGLLGPSDYRILVPCRDAAKIIWQRCLFDAPAIMLRLCEIFDDVKQKKLAQRGILQPGIGLKPTEQWALHFPLIQAGIQFEEFRKATVEAADTCTPESTNRRLMTFIAAECHQASMMVLESIPFSGAFLLDLERSCSSSIVPGLTAAKADYARYCEPMVLKNQGLVYRYLNQSRWNNSPHAEDLEQAGKMGLLRAAELYSLASETTFAWYATPWVKEFLATECRRIKGTIPIPPKLQRIMRLIETERKRLPAGEMEKGADVAYLSEKLQLLPRQLAQALNWLEKRVVSLNQTGGNEDGQELLNFLSAPEVDQAKEVVRAELREQIRAEMAILPPDVIEILSLRYGLRLMFNNGAILDDPAASPDSRSLKEVSALLGLPPEAVGQIERKGIATLRNRQKPVASRFELYTRDEEPNECTEEKQKITDRFYTDANLNITLAQAGLPTRLTNALASQGVFLLGDLIRFSEAKLLEMPKLGKFAIELIREALGKFQLRLAG